MRAGEEPYSIAIMLSEVGLPARRYQIDAIDISARRLANARRGVFSKNAFRGPPSPYQTQYFRSHHEAYEIDPAIRKTCAICPGEHTRSPSARRLFCATTWFFAATLDLLGSFRKGQFGGGY